jgi:signal transduction histidine kinase
MVWRTLFGFLFGYFILHPVAMVVFRWLDPRFAMLPSHADEHLLHPVAHSFQPEMAPMGIVFGLFVALIAAIDGYQRATIARQRDELAQQAALLLEHNERLVKLERTNRRTMQYMVHDFKTHLGAIIGFAEYLLERNNPPPDTRSTDSLLRIRRQASRMLGSVMDLLAFTKLQFSGELRLEEVTVGTLLQEATADLSLPLQNGCVEIGTGYVSCPSINVDSRMIVRVLVNLAFNALRHNPPGTHVMLDAESLGEGQEVVFSCVDDGRGIPADLMSVVLSKDGLGSDTEYRDSTGLGLAYCRAAVEAHGGRIWCESRGGQGARFYFTIPQQTGGPKDVT